MDKAKATITRIDIGHNAHVSHSGATRSEEDQIAFLQLRHIGHRRTLGVLRTRSARKLDAVVFENKTRKAATIEPFRATLPQTIGDANITHCRRNEFISQVAKVGLHRRSSLGEIFLIFGSGFIAFYCLCQIDQLSCGFHGFHTRLRRERIALQHGCIVGHVLLIFGFHTVDVRSSKPTTDCDSSNSNEVFCSHVTIVLGSNI